MCLAFPCNDTPPCPSSTAPCRLDRQGRKIDRLRGESTDLRSTAADLSSEPAKRQAPKKGHVACILLATTSASGGCGGPGCTGATRLSLSICCSGGTSPSGALSKTRRAISDHAKHIHTFVEVDAIAARSRIDDEGRWCTWASTHKHLTPCRTARFPGSSQGLTPWANNVSSTLGIPAKSTQCRIHTLNSPPPKASRVTRASPCRSSHSAGVPYHYRSIRG